MKLKLLVIALVPFAFATVTFPCDVQAVEVDDFGAHYSGIKDSTDLINGEMNRRLLAVAKQTKSCSVQDFEGLVWDSLKPKGFIAKIFKGGLEEWVENESAIDRYVPSLGTSVFRNTPMSRNILIIAGKITQIGTVFPSIRTNQQIHGIDKISHFIETGYELYDKHLRKSPYPAAIPEEAFNRLLEESIKLEEDYLGWALTGVKSHADIVAHLQGSLFWREFFSPEGGWWSCEQGKIQMKKRFDLRAYVHAGWSEAINCNEFGTKENATTGFADFFTDDTLTFAEAVDSNLLEWEKKSGRRYICPVEPNGCAEAAAHLRRILPDPDRQLLRVLGPKCRDFMSR